MALVMPLFEPPRGVVPAYAVGAIGFSALLLVLSLRRGPEEFACWLVAYAVAGALALARPHEGPLFAGFLAFLLGFARTHREGPNLDLGLALVALSVGLFLLRGGRGRERRLDLAGLLLLSIAAWSVVSLGFSVARVRGFAPAPGFGYHVYRFNFFGLSSEEALVRAAIGAAATFTWFGLYEFARTAAIDARRLGVAVVLTLGLNSAALLVQRHLDPGFLHPAGLPLIDRLNGVTSFCYALGDATLGFFLLLPVWGALRGRRGALTAAGVVLMLHAVVASGSRTTLFAMLAAVLLWAGVWFRQLQHEGRRGGALVPLGLAAVVVLATAGAYWLSPADQATPLGRLKEGVERQGLWGHIVATRLGSYPLALRVLQHYPLSGVGAGLYQAEVDKQRALLTPDRPIPDSYLLNSYAPNQFLNTGVELGVPALLGLVAVFVAAGAAATPRAGGGGSSLLLVSLLALAGALQFGPSFYNSEALVFSWLIVGLAAASGAPGRTPAERVVGRTATVVALGALLALAVTGHLLSRPALAVERQWSELRWRLNIGMQPEQADGRWTAAAATFSIDTPAPVVALRWHVGDPSVPGYVAEVSFYVDGVLVERSLARPGVIRESRLPLPSASGFKRISVRVTPPFVPAHATGRSDDRRLGVFLHSVKPVGTGGPGSASRP
jgi:hypothetical protein